MSMNERILTSPVVLIPAYKPDKRLENLAWELCVDRQFELVVVDDGNSDEYADLFRRLQLLPRCTVRRHSTNRGKGAALKTGVRYIKEHFPQCVGAVTADADGQHSAEDIQRVALSLQSHPTSLVLGVRDFSGADVPAKSRLGNRVTARLFRLATGVRCPDTQTGLRGIPAAAFDRYLALPGQRYELEMNHLLDCAKCRMPFVQLPISTIYLEGNKSSHYRPLMDSLRIAGVVLRFSASSLAGAAVDLLLFWLLSSTVFKGAVVGAALATVGARLVSGCVNYSLNLRWVFQGRPGAKTALRYMALFFTLMGTSALLVSAAGQVTTHLVAAKLAVDSVLFIFSYLAQKHFVFSADLNTEKCGVAAHD